MKFIIVICDCRDEYEKVIHSNDAFAPVGYLKLKKAHLVTKSVSLFHLQIIVAKLKRSKVKIKRFVGQF